MIPDNHKKRRARRIAADEAHAWARNLRLGNAHAKYVLCMLTLYVNSEGVCFVSIPQLSDDCELAGETIRRRLAWLEEVGAIARRSQWIDESGRRNSEGNGRRTSDEIMLLLDSDPEQIEAKAHPDDDGTDGQADPVCEIGSDERSGAACHSASPPVGTPLTPSLRTGPESSEPEPEEAGDGKARAREPLISEQAIQLASDVMQILGIDAQFVPPGWCGASMWLQAGLSSGWRPEFVRIAAARVRARKNYQPPFSYRYLGAPIVREHELMAEPSLPMSPTVVASKQGAANASKTAADPSRASWQASRDRWRAAAAELNASVAEDEAREGADGEVVQFAAAPRRNRP